MFDENSTFIMISKHRSYYWYRDLSWFTCTRFLKNFTLNPVFPAPLSLTISNSLFYKRCVNITTLCWTLLHSFHFYPVVSVYIVMFHSFSVCLGFIHASIRYTMNGSYFRLRINCMPDFNCRLYQVELLRQHILYIVVRIKWTKMMEDVHSVKSKSVLQVAFIIHDVQFPEVNNLLL